MSAAIDKGAEEYRGSYLWIGPPSHQALVGCIQKPGEYYLELIVAFIPESNVVSQMESLLAHLRLVVDALVDVPFKITEKEPVNVSSNPNA